jgi:hypothetical protein
MIVDIPYRFFKKPADECILGDERVHEFLFREYKLEFVPIGEYFFENKMKVTPFRRVIVHDEEKLLEFILKYS